jgi:methylated-DNA-[protein]-cysteine S-methyltransferase
MPAATYPFKATRLRSRIGDIVAVVDGAGALVYLDFEEKTGPTPAPTAADWRGHPVVWSEPEAEPALANVARQIDDYFAGKLTAFDLAVAPIGNDFHQGVWAQLQRIPYGETISYGELAKRLDMVNGARAVGRANGHNPIAIVIPCHRVIGADGKLTGYSGGIERKAALLALEQASTPAGQHILPLDIAPGTVRRKK